MSIMNLFEMSPVAIGIAGMVMFLVLMALRMPIGFSMLLVGFLGFIWLLSLQSGLVKLSTVPFATMYSYDFSVIPLFILMAHICFTTNISGDLYNLAYRWFGRLPGGLAMATIFACAIFSAISATTVSVAVTMALVALPEMKKYKYDDSLATGSVIAGGTMGVLIPPSAVLIIYGIIAEESIGKLFLAGIIPGILEAVFYMATVGILCYINPSLGPSGPRFTLKEKLVPIMKCGEIIVLIALVLGGLFIGWFTPTEAGAVGAVGSIIIGMVRGRLTWKGFKESCLETAKNTGMLFAMLIGALLLGYFLTATKIPIYLAEFVGGLNMHRLGVMTFILVIYFMLGFFVPAMPMLLLTVPIFLPMIKALGFDPIWFGILVVRMNEIAVITPPVAINIYAVAGVVEDVPIQTMFKGVIPFVIADLLNVALLVLVPQLSLFLPNFSG